MSDSAPKLVAVPAPQEPAPDGASGVSPQPADAGRGRRLGWVAWLLVALLALGVGLQTVRAGSLGQRVQALEGDLAGARAELAEAHGALRAFELHMDEVRGAVSGLKQQLAALDTLVGTGPATPPAPDPEPAAAELPTP